jgi:hypothetical protein
MFGDHEESEKSQFQGSPQDRLARANERVVASERFSREGHRRAKGRLPIRFLELLTDWQNLPLFLSVHTPPNIPQFPANGTVIGEGLFLPILGAASMASLRKSLPLRTAQPPQQRLLSSRTPAKIGNEFQFSSRY